VVTEEEKQNKRNLPTPQIFNLASEEGGLQREAALFDTKKTFIWSQDTQQSLLSI
jgi:hypothetical protein